MKESDLISIDKSPVRYAELPSAEHLIIIRRFWQHCALNLELVASNGDVDVKTVQTLQSVIRWTVLTASAYLALGIHK